MRQVESLARRAANTELSVLVTGETGTGKELVARTIHGLSGRAGKPFLAVNCGSLRADLALSQLFGHRKGAFTGAHADGVGLVEAAHTGTLFLDEIGELPLDVQVTLLRFLESGEYMRLGETHVRRADVRIIAATNRELRGSDEKMFRRDLLFRLNEIEIRVPALRDRSEDILPLARHFLVAVRGADATLADDACAALLRHDWRGNVRELKHRIEAAALLHDALRITADMLGLPDRRESCAVHTLRLPGADLEEHLWDLIDRDKLSFATAIAHCERVLIRAALRVEENSRTRAAGRLGIHVRTIYKKLNASGVPVRPCPVGHDLPERSSLAAVLGAE
jgi:DNA-binding NtrC family response regulator